MQGLVGCYNSNNKITPFLHPLSALGPILARLPCLSGAFRFYAIIIQSSIPSCSPQGSQVLMFSKSTQTQDINFIFRFKSLLDKCLKVVHRWKREQFKGK